MSNGMTFIQAAGATVVLSILTLSPQAGATDLLIQGGTVVTAEGERKADIRIRGETIDEIGSLERVETDARVLDASGLLILPGGVDPHVHLTSSEEFAFADDFESGTRAALAGGITTVGHMAFPVPGEGPLATLARESVPIEELTMADVFVHTTIFEPEVAIAELPELAAAGQPSIKVFMPFEPFDAEMPGYLRLLRGARDAGIVVAIHCEDAAALEFAAQELTGAGKTSLAHYPESRPIISEVVATERALAMAEITGAPIYIVHLSAARALAAAEAAQSRSPVFVETRPLYLHFTGANYQRPDGALFVGMPPIRGTEDRQAMWEGLASGAIATLATDHAPWTREEKLDPQQTITSFRPGVNNLQVMLPMLFSEGVHGGKISLQRFVEVSSTNAAKLFGLYPRKGTVAPGSDADLVIWDPDERRTIADSDVLSKTGFSIYAGTEVTGWPQITIRRGEVVYEGGEVDAEKGSGRIISRSRFKIPVE